MGLRIRFVTKGDLADMYRVSISAHSKGYEALIPSDHRDSFYQHYSISNKGKAEYEHLMGGHLNDSDYTILCAEIDGKVAGYTVWWRQNEASVQMKGLFVHPDFQGQGIGRALLDAVIPRFSNLEMYLFVIENNEPARVLYKKYAFVDDGLASELFYGAKQMKMVRR